MDNVVLYLLCLVLGVAGAWVIFRWGSSLGLLDKPSDRSSHEGIVPKGGGIGILATFFVCSIVTAVPKSFWIPAAVVSLISLWGDKSEIRARNRLLLQFVAAIILLYGIFSNNQNGAMALALIPPFAIFIVGTANYYNFMDGINGIAGIAGTVGFGLLAWFAAVEGADSRAVTLCLCLCLACLGFLPFNMPKARVFMGDVGSILLGVVFAGMVVWLTKSFLDLLCGAAFLFPFYADELTTEFGRLRDGENLMEPHRRHVYQLLANEIGIAHWKVSLGYGVLQAAVGVGALVIRGYGTLAVLGFLGVCFTGFWVFGYWVRMRAGANANAARFRGAGV